MKTYVGSLELPPVCLLVPETGSQFFDWTPHFPFLAFLMHYLRPKRFVELGVLDGNSYFAACQYVKVLGLDCECVAIDPWEGVFKAEAGHQARQSYSADFFQKVSLKNGEYVKFSRLVRDYSEKAIDEFEDRTIDLLHIDANHVYEAVKRDYETWFPKVSENGVVIIHDTMNLDAGVCRLWAELSASGANTFLNALGHGLGVVFKGDKYPEQLSQLYSSSTEEIENIDSVFQQLGWLMRYAVPGERQARR